MGMYWFFDLMQVARRNQVLSSLRLTYSVDDAWKKFEQCRKELKPRPTPEYPLP